MLTRACLRFRLDLKVADHRRVAYLLTLLDAQEPGNGWVRAKYNRKSIVRAPEEWLAGLPQTGKLSLSFSSYTAGSAPDWGFRLKMCEFVLPTKTDAILL